MSKAEHSQQSEVLLVTAPGHTSQRPRPRQFPYTEGGSATLQLLTMDFWFVHMKILRQMKQTKNLSQFAVRIVLNTWW